MKEKIETIKYNKHSREFKLHENLAVNKKKKKKENREKNPYNKWAYYVPDKVIQNDQYEAIS